MFCRPSIGSCTLTDLRPSWYNPAQVIRLLEVSRLQAKVDRLVDRGLSQTDPRVIAASEAVDKLVVEKMRQRAASGRLSNPDVMELR